MTILVIFVAVMLVIAFRGGMLYQRDLDDERYLLSGEWEGFSDPRITKPVTYANVINFDPNLARRRHKEKELNTFTRMIAAIREKKT